MNGLPHSIDLSPLIGRQLVQLCFGAWTVALMFDGPVRIVVESKIEISDTGGLSYSSENFCQDASLLCRLIGSTVNRAVRMNDGGMQLDGSVRNFVCEPVH